MATMICGKCHQYGIYWKNLGGFNQHTYCPHCGGVNCQEPEEQKQEEESEAQNDSL